MKNVLSILLLLLCCAQAFGQLSAPRILNIKSGKTVTQSINLYFAHSNSIKDLRILVEISKSNKFNLAADSLVFFDSVPLLQLDFLRPGVSFFIRSMILDDRGFSSWSETFEISASDIVSEFSHSPFYTSKPSLKVHWIYDYAQYFEVQFDTMPDFSSAALFSDTVSSTSYSYESQILFSKIYYRIRPVNRKVVGKWSIPRLYDGYWKPQLSSSSNEDVYHSSSLRTSASNLLRTGYRWQVSIDSTFTTNVVDTLATNSIFVANGDFDTDYYTRVAYESKGLRSAWTYDTKYSLEGPKFRSFYSSRNSYRSTSLRTWFYAYKDSMEVEISKDSLFQNTDKLYQGVYDDQLTLNSLFREKRQYVRWRVYNKRDTSSWSSSIVVFKGNLVEPIALNGIEERYFANRLFAPNGTLSFTNYGANLKKVWVELDTTTKFDSDKKVTLESERVKVEVPDLYMGQTYFIRYRMAYNDGYEEKEWSDRTLEFKTLNELNFRRNYTSSNYIVRDIEIDTVPYFSGSIQLQLFEGPTTSKDFIRLDTLINGAVTNILLPFDTAARYMARLVNKVDTSNWIISSLKPYTKPLITAPVDGSTLTIDSALLAWKDTSSVCQYTVQIDTQKLQNFEQGTLIDVGRSFPYVQVEPNKTYYWRIKARTRMDISSWSKVSTFVTDDNSSVPLLPESAVRVYPNPVTTHLTVDTRGSSDTRILSMQGNVVIEVHGQGPMQVNTSTLQPGVYILEVSTVDGVYCQQFEKF